MSILQIELPEDVRQKLEERAASQGRDLSSWVREQLEATIVAPTPNQTQWEEQKLLEALDSGPGIAVDDAWWDSQIAQLNRKLDVEGAV